MMKIIRIILCSFLAVLFATALSGCGIDKYDIYDFSLADYQDYLDSYKLDEEWNDISICGKIESATDAVEKARIVMERVYGEATLGTKGPYSVYYDEHTDTWLVIGSTLFVKGSGAHVVLKGDNGEVLAVWNYKF